MSSQKLQFYTLGPDFTYLLRSFINEGSFEKVYLILKDGGAPDEYIRHFFLFEAQFIGDTRNDTFEITTCDRTEELGEIYHVAFKTLLSQYDCDFYNDNYFKILEKNEDKNYLSLLKVLPKGFFQGLLGDFIINRFYEINPPKTKRLNGVILKDGRFIKCGFQEHNYLYRILYTHGLSESSDWVNDTLNFHITEGQLNGGALDRLSHPTENYTITKEQIKTLWEYKDVLIEYGYHGDTVAELFRDNITHTINKGGKYNNLIFLQKFYTNIKLPKFSLQPLDLENQCIRTSPRYSLPGLLNSKFNVTDFDQAINEIKEEFEKHKEIIGAYKSDDRIIFSNEIHYFFQEFLDGPTGVANSKNHDEFNYSISYDNSFDVVSGKESYDVIKKLSHERELRSILTQLRKDLNQSVQVEFTIHNDEIYILQLRTLANEPEERRPYTIDESQIICKGLSFSKGTTDILSINDVLVVDNDIKNPDELKNKKGLIVRNKNEFSHVLALSQVLRIPSLYGVGDVNLPEKLKLDCNAFEGLILNV